jgi:hypothetical protein
VTLDISISLRVWVGGEEGARGVVTCEGGVTCARGESSSGLALKRAVRVG